MDSSKSVSSGNRDESPVPLYLGTPPQTFINNPFGQQPGQPYMTVRNEPYNYDGVGEYGHTCTCAESQIPKTQNEPVTADVRFIQGAIPAVTLSQAQASNLNQLSQNSQSQPTERLETNVQPSRTIGTLPTSYNCVGNCCVPYSSLFQEPSALPNPPNQFAIASVGDFGLAINLTLVINYPTDSRPFTPLDCLEGTTYEATQPSYLSENVCICPPSPAPRPGPQGSEPFRESCATSSPNRPLSNALTVHRATQCTSCESCHLCSNERVPMVVKQEIQLQHTTQLDEGRNSIQPELHTNIELTSDSANRFAPMRNSGALKAAQAINLAESYTTMTTIMDPLLPTLENSGIKCDESPLMVGEIEQKLTVTIIATSKPGSEIRIQLRVPSLSSEEHVTVGTLCISIKGSADEDPTHNKITVPRSSPTVCVHADQPRVTDEVLKISKTQSENQALRRCDCATPKVLLPESLSSCSCLQEIKVRVILTCEPQPMNNPIITSTLKSCAPIKQSKTSKLSPRTQESSGLALLRRFSRSCVRTVQSEEARRRPSRRRASSNPPSRSRSLSRPMCLRGRESAEENKNTEKSGVQRSLIPVTSTKEKEPCFQRIKSRLNQAKSKCHEIKTKLKKRQHKRPLKSEYVLESIADKLSRKESLSRSQSLSPSGVEANQDSTICTPYLCLGWSSEARGTPVTGESHQTEYSPPAVDATQVSKKAKPNLSAGEKQPPQSGEALRCLRRFPFQRKSRSLSENTSPRVSLTFRGEELSRKPSSAVEYSGRAKTKSMKDSVNTWGASVTRRVLASHSAATSPDEESKSLNHCGTYSWKKMVPTKSAELLPIRNTNSMCPNECICQRATDNKTSSKLSPLPRMPVLCHMKLECGISTGLENPKTDIVHSKQLFKQVINKENVSQIQLDFSLGPGGVTVSSASEDQKYFNSNPSPGVAEQTEHTPGYAALVTKFSTPEQNQLIYDNGGPQTDTEHHDQRDLQVRSTGLRKEVCSCIGNSFPVQIRSISDPLFHATTVTGSKDKGVGIRLELSAVPQSRTSYHPGFSDADISVTSPCSSPVDEKSQNKRVDTPLQPSEECAHVSQQIESPWGNVFLQTNMDARFRSQPTYVNESSLKKKQERVKKFTVSEVPIVERTRMSEKMDIVQNNTPQTEADINEAKNYVNLCQSTARESQNGDDGKPSSLHSPTVIQAARAESVSSSDGTRMHNSNAGLIATDYSMCQFSPGSCATHSALTYTPPIPLTPWAYIPPVIGTISQAKTCDCNPYSIRTQYPRTLTTLSGPLNQVAFQFNENLLLSPVRMKPVGSMRRVLEPCRCVQISTSRQSCSTARQLCTRSQSCSPTFTGRQLYETQNICMYTHCSPPADVEDQPEQIQTGRCVKNHPKSKLTSDNIDLESHNAIINDSHATSEEEVRTVVRSFGFRHDNGIRKEPIGSLWKKSKKGPDTKMVRWKLSAYPKKSSKKDGNHSVLALNKLQLSHVSPKLVIKYSAISIIPYLSCAEEETELLVNRATLGLFLMIHWHPDLTIPLKQRSCTLIHCNIVQNHAVCSSIVSETFVNSSTHTDATRFLPKDQWTDRSADSTVCLCSHPSMVRPQDATLISFQVISNQETLDIKPHCQLSQTETNTDLHLRHTPPIQTFVTTNTDRRRLTMSSIMSAGLDDISHQASPSVSLDLISSSLSTAQWCYCGCSSLAVYEKSSGPNPTSNGLVNSLDVAEVAKEQTNTTDSCALFEGKQNATSREVTLRCIADVQKSRRRKIQEEETHNQKQNGPNVCIYANEKTNKSPAKVQSVHTERKSGKIYAQNKYSPLKFSSTELTETKTDVMDTNRNKQVHWDRSLSGSIRGEMVESKIAGAGKRGGSSRRCSCCLCTRTAWTDVRNSSQRSPSTLNRRKTTTDKLWTQRSPTSSPAMHTHGETKRHMACATMQASNLNHQQTDQNKIVYSTSRTSNGVRHSTISHVRLGATLERTHQRLDLNHHLVPKRHYSVNERESLRKDMKGDCAKRKTYPPFRF